VRKRRKQAYKSGYCAYAPHQKPCKGEFQNGSLVVPRVTLCSCDCHGDYEARMTAAGQRLVLEETDIEDDDNDE
jgi:hypothetical protein